MRYKDILCDIALPFIMVLLMMVVALIIMFPSCETAHAEETMTDYFTCYDGTKIPINIINFESEKYAHSEACSSPIIGNPSWRMIKNAYGKDDHLITYRKNGCYEMRTTV